MGERKVLNKYYPPNFDPSKIPRRRKRKNQQMKVRTMLPMSIRCNFCGNYMYAGTKFNARKEDIEKTYLGIKCFRFYFNCTNCSAEIVKRTDPQNSDYVIETGATRLFEHCRIREDVESEDTGDVMKGLENRMLESKREMELVARVEELKSVQARRGGVSVDTLLEELRRRGEEKMVDEEDDEALVKSMFRARSEKDVYVLRIDDDDDGDDSDEIADNVCVKKQKVSEVDSSKFVTSDVKQPVLQSKAPAVRFMVTRKRVQKSGGDSDAVKKEDTASGLQSLCHTMIVKTNKHTEHEPLASVLRFMVMRNQLRIQTATKTL